MYPAIHLLFDISFPIPPKTPNSNNKNPLHDKNKKKIPVIHYYRFS